MNAWAKFLTKYYRDKKRTQKNYTFMQAMKDAKKEYKKQGGQQNQNQQRNNNQSKRTRVGGTNDGNTVKADSAVKAEPAVKDDSAVKAEPDGDAGGIPSKNVWPSPADMADDRNDHQPEAVQPADNQEAAQGTATAASEMPPADKTGGKSRRRARRSARKMMRRGRRSARRGRR